ncbi:MAG: hypothetical protein JNM51_13885 [Bacteroidia bacterium]|nr:hypothetical protein [Bacteroidia bacterium]
MMRATTWGKNIGKTEAFEPESIIIDWVTEVEIELIETSQQYNDTESQQQHITSNIYIYLDR